MLIVNLCVVNPSAKRIRQTDSLRIQSWDVNERDYIVSLLMVNLDHSKWLTTETYLLSNLVD